MTDIYLSGSTGGTSTLSTPHLALTLSFSGHVEAVATVGDNEVIDLSGSAGGVATLSQAAFAITRNFAGAVHAFASVTASIPDPIFGVSSCSALMTVERQPPTICSLTCHPVALKSFRLGYIFTRGDLPLYLTDPTGTRKISPYSVRYTIFQQRSNNTTHQVGPSDRQPVMQVTGEYYATGTAGELGQPGNYQIRWCYRRTFDAPLETATFAFQVVDSVLDPIPGDPTCRKKKYGWI